MRGHSRMVLIGALLSATTTLHAQTFDFEGAALGITTPFSQSSGGMTATFTSPDGPSLFSVTTTFFSTLTGHILYDSNGAPDRLAVAFDRPLSRIQLTFATKGPGFFTLTAFLGAERVGSLSFLGSIPAGLILPEGHALFEDTPFDNVLLSSTASDFAVDDVVVRAVASVPEPTPAPLVATGLLVLAAIWRRRAGVRRIAGSARPAYARARGATVVGRDRRIRNPSREASMRRHFAMVLVGVVVSGAATLHAQTFDFEAAALNTTTPFSQSNGGVTATFTSPDGADLFSVTTTFFSTLTGRVLLDQNGTPDRLAIGFNQPLSTISMSFATNGAGPLTLAAFFGANPVGSVTVAGAVPAGFTFPEGILTFTGGPFDNVLMSSTALDFAIDNITVRTVSAVPEPAAVALVATGLLGLVPVLRRRVGVSRG